jgi:hypothetical protein
MAVSKGGSKQSTGFDPQTTEWIRRIYGNTMVQAGNPAYGAGAAGAGDFFNQGMQTGQAGMEALTGDPSRFMNPYENQVVGAINRDWAQTNATTMRSVDDAAQGAGAFGGSRHGVATGTALAQNNMNQQNQLAQLRAGGFESAMGRAAQAANFGMGAAGGAMQADQARLATSPLGIMKFGLAGTPFGTKGKSSQWGVTGTIPGLG